MLQQFPDYLHCYLRLACIADAKGRRKEALHWLRDALERQPDNPDALALKGGPLSTYALLSKRASYKSGPWAVAIQRRSDPPRLLSNCIY